MLGDQATATEREILSAFPYQANTAVLHTQHDVLPKTRRAWASWNYYNPVEPSESATVTYNMNILQSLESEKVFCVTLNDRNRIRDENVIGSWQYYHPTFNVKRSEMQGRHDELLNVKSTSFCGAYWGNGFHEDGVRSAMSVAEKLQKVTAPC
jgi:predicted NAD/FAD-binding protein